MLTKNRILILSFIFLIGNNIFAQNEKRNCIKEIPKKEGIKYDCLDLSNQDLDSIPNLSHLKIKELNLSHNKIKQFNENFLPLEVENLNLSHNDLTVFKFPIEGSNRLIHLVDLNLLDVSYNKLVKADLYYLANLPELKDIRLNNNNLSYLMLQNPRYIEFLDISDNPKLSNEVYFNPEKVKKIKRDNIANKKPLLSIINAILAPPINKK